MTRCDGIDPGLSPATAPDLPEGVPPLRTFYLYLTASCNLRCRHCWIAPEYTGSKAVAGTSIDLAALKEAVKEAKTLGLANAKLTGGEPMLHPQFLEIVDMLTSAGLHMNMETNGTLLTRKMAKYLKDETHVSFISVSIDSPDPVQHDQFRGVKGAFDATIRGLDHLVKAGYTNTQVIMSVHRGNRDQMEGLVRLAAEHKAASVKFNPVTLTGRGIAMHKRGEALDFDEYLAVFRQITGEIQPQASIPVTMMVPPALIPFGELWRTKGDGNDCGVSSVLGILGTGDIALCGVGQTIAELVYGHLGKDSIRSIWLSHPLIQKLRRELENYPAYSGICGSCIHAKTCRTGCIADNYMHNKKLVSPQWLCAEADRRGVFPQSRLR
jgi:SynChlorMet cassette radical SAM/SPASM protein ScmF